MLFKAQSTKFYAAGSLTRRVVALGPVLLLLGDDGVEEGDRAGEVRGGGQHPVFRTSESAQHFTVGLYFTLSSCPYLPDNGVIKLD